MAKHETLVFLWQQLVLNSGSELNYRARYLCTITFRLESPKDEIEWNQRQIEMRETENYFEMLFVVLVIVEVP